MRSEFGAGKALRRNGFAFDGCDRDQNSLFLPLKSHQPEQSVTLHHGTLVGEPT